MKARPESFAVTRLELFFHDIYLGCATGFLYKFGQDLGLVSNWHVFEGRHPTTGELRNKDGCKPNIVKFHISIFDPAKGAVLLRGESLPLLRDGEPLWLQHEPYVGAGNLAKNPDVGVLILNDLLPDFEVICERIISFPAQVVVNVTDSEEDWTTEQGYPRVASDVFILGYPRGLAKQGVFPIWKRGSIASEPLFYALDNDPVILVDSVTREGMSGAPVLYYGDVLTDQHGHVQNQESRKGEPWLVGVYAGREGVSTDELDMALGRVWRKEILDEIFFQRKPGGWIATS